MFKRRSQISMEYILITAFSLLVAMPLVILFFNYSQNYNNELSLSQTNKVMDEILNSAETVYYLGEPSQKTIIVYFPKKITNIVFGDGYFSFTIEDGENSYTLYRTAPINFTGNISTSPGAKKIKIKALNNTIHINT